jgi:hypothetical protein
MAAVHLTMRTGLCGYELSVEVITGIILLLCIIALTRTFYARTKLKTKWFQMHGHMSIALVVIMIVHVLLSIL